jgi:hypothetical protein
METLPTITQRAFGNEILLQSNYQIMEWGNAIPKFEAGTNSKTTPHISGTKTTYTNAVKR